VTGAKAKAETSNSGREGEGTKKEEGGRAKKLNGKDSKTKNYNSAKKEGQYCLLFKRINDLQKEELENRICVRSVQKGKINLWRE